MLGGLLESWDAMAHLFSFRRFLNVVWFAKHYLQATVSKPMTLLSLDHPPPRLGPSGLREGSPSSRNRASALGSSILGEYLSP